jgi:2-C-methyl-D-erythritol 4-phosphate cytidylyltransferase
MEINKYAIIVAGGSGSRMQASLPKQFMMLAGKPVLYYSINTFLQTFAAIKIILVLPEEYVANGQEIIDAYFKDYDVSITIGGRTRFHSTQNGLALVTDNESIVFVHDAARPLVTQKILKACLFSAEQTGSAIPVIDCNDSMRIISDEGNAFIDRSVLKLVQTPQTFHSKIIIPAFSGIDYKEKFTDEASVVEAFGLKVTLVPGDPINIKITNPIDFVIAEKLLV